MLKQHAKPSTRRQDIIHPSEVAKTGWCPRSTYERIKRCRALGDPYWKPSESVSVQLLNIFDEGHYIHDKWQKRLAAMGDLWGHWRCDDCGYLIENFWEYDDRCPRCKSHIGYSYAEIPLRDKKLLIAGHADGAVPRLNSLIEIKSVGVGTARIEAPEIFKANSEGTKVDLTGLWRDIKEPFPAHVRQGQLYLYLCQNMDFGDEEIKFNKIIFLYESKFNQGAKEFVVKYDRAAISDVLTHIENIVDALENNSIIECPFGGCKDCDIYGNEKSGITNGMGGTSEQDQHEGSEGSGTTIGGSARTSKRIIRPT